MLQRLHQAEEVDGDFDYEGNDFFKDIPYDVTIDDRLELLIERISNTTNEDNELFLDFFQQRISHIIVRYSIQYPLLCGLLYARSEAYLADYRFSPRNSQQYRHNWMQAYDRALFDGDNESLSSYLLHEASALCSPHFIKFKEEDGNVAQGIAYFPPDLVQLGELLAYIAYRLKGPVEIFEDTYI